MKAVINKNGLLKVPRNKYADYNIVYPYKHRTIDLEKPIMVYKNLNNGMYSVKQSGLVVAHAERLCLKDFECVINESGRKRAVRTGERNVHAFIKGKYTTSGMGTSAERNDLPAVIRYNPFKNKTFICDNITDKSIEVKSGMFCIFDKEGVRGAYINTNPV